jgi:hypothetical protein
MSDTRAQRPYSIGMFWFVTLLVAGCVSLGRSGGLSWTLTEPPALAADATPLDAATGAPARQSVAKPAATDPSRGTAPLAVAGDNDRRRALSAPEPITNSHARGGSPPAIDPASPTTASEGASPPALDKGAGSPAFTSKRTVDVAVSGPDQRTLGSRAEFVVTLTNVSGRTLPGARVEIDYPDPLRLKEVSSGAARKPGRLAWDLGNLLVDERVQIQLEFECAAVADDALLSVVAGGTGFQTPPRTAPLHVAPVSRLDLQLADSADPIALRETTEYTIHVLNVDTVAHRNVTLFLMQSGQFRLGAIEARAGRRILPIRSSPTREGQTIAIAEVLAPGESFTLIVPAAAQDAGVGQLVVVLSTDSLPSALKVRETTVVDPPVVRTN